MIFMDLKETYNQIAEDWCADHDQDDWWKEGTDIFISLLKPGALVLDVGCGGGLKSKYLAERGLSVVGIDFSEKMIAIAKREVSSATFLVCDLGEVSTLPYQFDGIFAEAVLVHVPRKEIIEKLKTMTKKLKNGGYLRVSVKEKRTGQMNEEIRVENDYGYPYERFFSYFTLDEITADIRKTGLTKTYATIKPVGKANWIQIIGKK